MRFAVFHTLRGRLTAQYAAIFVFGMLLLTGSLFLAIEAISKTEVQKQLDASGAIYERIWTQRSEHMQEAAGLMARDFGFREALATEDAATARSALENLKSRLGIDSAFFLSVDGTAIVGNELPSSAQARDMLEAFGDGKLVGVAMMGGTPRQLVAAPVKTPRLLGWIVFAPKLDSQNMQSMQGLSSIPVSAGVVVQRAGSGWEHAAVEFSIRGKGTENRPLDASGLQGRSGEIDVGGSANFFAMQPLNSIGQDSKAALLLLYTPGHRAR